MASEYVSIDVSGEPDLLKLAEEVRRTNRPRVLRRDGEDLAVIVPVMPEREQTRSPSGLQAADTSQQATRKTSTLESVFGSVSGRNQPEDFDQMIREVKEERAERLVRKL